jgi:hypothetical protein
MFLRYYSNFFDLVLYREMVLVECALSSILLSISVHLLIAACLLCTAGQCATGYFCPQGSSAAVGNGAFCSPGFYCPAGSSSSTQVVCPPGQYCVDGPLYLPPPNVAAGYYSTGGASSVFGNGSCAPGAWCSPGSVTPLGAGACPVWCCRLRCHVLDTPLPHWSFCWSIHPLQ